MRLGLRIRVLAAAGLIALVSLATFGALLKGLQDQRSSAAKGRVTTDAVAQADAIGRLMLATRTSRDAAEAAHARAALPAAGRRLVAVEPNPLAKAIARDLAAGRYDAIGRELSAFTVAERREQLRLRAQSTALRDRAIVIAAGGLAILLVLIAALAFGAVRAIVGPVSRLQRFARELGTGRFDTRLPETGPPETAELAQAFNRTAESLQRVTDRHLAELDAVFRDAPIGIAFLDTDLRFLRVNDALADMNRVPAADHLGRTVLEVTGQADVAAALRRVVEAGEPVLDHDVALHGRRFEASYFPVRDDSGALLAVGKAMTDVTERRRAESARERLQAVTAALAGAVTVGDVARAAVEEAGALLEASTAILLTLSDDGARLQIVGDRGLSTAARREWGTVAISDEIPSATAARTATSLFMADEAALLARFPHLAGAPYPRAGAYAQLPLIAYGRVLGVLSVTFRGADVFDDDERALLHALAAQVAIALARAQLYEREHAVAQTLQASLLPRALPEIPGLDLAGRLEAGATGVEVGGDFYDAFAISDGVWGIAIGDVCGKGVDAAALTALARHTVRAAAHEQRSPAAVLRALNRAVLAERRAGQFLTAIFARVSVRGDGGFHLTLACGGHPPPVLLDAGLARRALDCSGTLLGVVAEPDIVDAALDLDPGDTLLLYTDGLTEAGAPQHTLDTAEVASLLASVRRGSAAQTADACLSRALQAAGGEVRDDIALLVAQVSAPVLAGASTAGRTAAGESSTPGQ